jgi:hypothetical protein
MFPTTSSAKFLSLPISSLQDMFFENEICSIRFLSLTMIVRPIVADVESHLRPENLDLILLCILTFNSGQKLEWLWQQSEFNLD